MINSVDKNFAKFADDMIVDTPLHGSPTPSKKSKKENSQSSHSSALRLVRKLKFTIILLFFKGRGGFFNGIFKQEKFIIAISQSLLSLY